MKKIPLTNNSKNAFDGIGKNICKNIFDAYGLYGILRAKVIRKIDKDVVTEVKEKYNQKKLICLISLEALTHKIGKDIRTLQKYMKILEEHGWIIINKFHGYYIIDMGGYKIVDGNFEELYYAEMFHEPCNCSQEDILPTEKKNYKTMKNKILEQETHENNKNVKRKKNYSEPSKLYTAYKTKEVDDWTPKEFFGYYLGKYIEIYDSEDPAFIGLSEGSYSRFFSLIKNTLKNIFHNNKEDMKDYIEWGMDYLEGKGYDCSITSIVSQSSITLKKYLCQNKTKKNKKLDNKFSDNERVKEYLKSQGKLKG